MAVPIEAYTVVAQKERIADALDAGEIKPKAIVLADDHLWRCSFMAHADALAFTDELEKLGLNTSQGPNSDVVIVNEFDQSIEPYCEWLQLGQWEKAWIAWKAGTQPKTVVARDGWDPTVGSGVTFSDGSDLEFIRMEGNIEVHRNLKTDKEVYINRADPSVEALYKSASAAIVKHMRTAGEPPITGPDAESLGQAVDAMQTVCEKAPESWRSWWLLGKGHIALGQHQQAYDAFRAAEKQQPNATSIPRELAGVCMELGRFPEAVEVALRAVSIEPDNPELIGNLAVCYLLARRLDDASRSIDAVLKMDPADSINRNIRRLITETQEGRRPQPTSLRDFNRPAKPSKKIWEFWKK